MSKIGVFILVQLLQVLEIDPNLYSKITGGLSEYAGRKFFKLCRYDPTKKCPGIDWHKDIRWITILYINEKGLQIKVNKKAIDIDPLKDHFVVNIGAFFEAFINNPEQLNACEHQVVQQVTQERVSFGVFCSGEYREKGFYQRHGSDILWKNSEEMNRFLVPDKDQRFSIGPHIIFKDTQ